MVQTLSIRPRPDGAQYRLADYGSWYGITLERPDGTRSVVRLGNPAYVQDAWRRILAG